MKNRYFTPRTKMADLIAANHTLILVIPRFGIPLGFGEKSVQEVCGQCGMPVDFFLLVCNLYTFDDYLPDSTQLQTVDMSHLVPYLEASHRYYLNERLPHISRHLARVADHAGPRYGDVLRKFIEGYRQDVEAHFSLEEKELFPYVSTAGSSAHIPQEVLRSHSELVEKLSDLPQIIYKYLPADGMVEELSELLFAILQLTSDLEKHALIEEKVLLPVVAMAGLRQASKERRSS